MHGTLAVTVIKNRKGRKRKSGRRTLSGAIARTSVDYRAMATEWPHRRSLTEAHRASEFAVDQIGTLYLLKRISEAQREAGRRFSFIVESHRSAICAPRGSAGNGHGDACNPSQCKADKAIDVTFVCSCEKRMIRYRDATAALQLRGQNVYNVTYRTAVSDEPCQDHELVHLRAGLSALAKHLGI